MLIASFLLSFVSLADGRTLFVDVEIDSNLRLRSKDNIDKIINALKRHEVVKVVDEKIRKYKGEDFILVRKVLFPELTCYNDPYDDGQFLGYFEFVFNDKEFKKYKKKSRFKNCPLLKFNYDSNKRSRRAFQRGSNEKLHEITGYVPLKHLKGFNTDPSYGEKQRSILANTGYRLVAPHDFTYFIETAYKKYQGFDGKYVSSFFIKQGYFFLPVFSEKFTKKKLQRYDLPGDSKSYWRYNPAIKVNDQFLLHLVKAGKGKSRYSVFALLSSSGKLQIIKSFDKAKEVGEILHLVPKNHKMVLHKDYIKWNQPMPFYGMDPGWGPTGFSEFTTVTKKEKFKDPSLINEIESGYNSSPEKLDFSFVIFSNYYMGDWEVNPYSHDGTMHAVEVFYKLKEAKEIQSSGLMRIFNFK